MNRALSYWLLIFDSGSLPYSCGSPLYPAPTGGLRLPAGKHRIRLTDYQTIVNKKMTKKCFFYSSIFYWNPNYLPYTLPKVSGFPCVDRKYGFGFIELFCVCKQVSHATRLMYNISLLARVLFCLLEMEVHNEAHTYLQNILFRINRPWPS